MPLPKERHALRHLRIKEASVVDAGANPGAHLMIFKHRDQPAENVQAGLMPMDDDKKKPKKPPFLKRLAAWAGLAEVEKMGEAKTVNEILTEDRFRREMFELKWAFGDSIRSILDGTSGEEQGAMLAKTVSEFTAAASALAAEVRKSGDTDAAGDTLAPLTDVLAELESAVAKATFNTEAEKVRLTKAIGKLDELFPTDDENPEDPMPAPTAKTFDDILASLTEADAGVIKTAFLTLTKKLDAVEKWVEDAKKASEPTEEQKAEEAAMKALPASIRKRLEDAETTAKSAAEKVERLETEKRAATFVEKARALDPDGMIGLEIDKAAKLLEKADRADPEFAAELERTLKGASARMKASDRILRSIGHAGSSGSVSPGSGAHAELTKRATEIAKASNGEFTFAQAYDRALEADPMLGAEAMDDDMIASN